MHLYLSVRTPGRSNLSKRSQSAPATTPKKSRRHDLITSATLLQSSGKSSLRSSLPQVEQTIITQVHNLSYNYNCVRVELGEKVNQFFN